ADGDHPLAARSAGAVASAAVHRRFHLPDHGAVYPRLQPGTDLAGGTARLRCGATGSAVRLAVLGPAAARPGSGRLGAGDCQRRTGGHPRRAPAQRARKGVTLTVSVMPLKTGSASW